MRTSLLVALSSSALLQLISPITEDNAGIINHLVREQKLKPKWRIANPKLAIIIFP